MHPLLSVLTRAGRALLLLIFAATGTILLVRCAPGYFSDIREMDGLYGQAAQREMQVERTSEDSIRQTIGKTARNWLHGDFGQSRQYEVPVAGLIATRIPVSARLLVEGIACGWLLAISAALPISALRRYRVLWGLPFTLLLSMPTAAMATWCIVADAGGPGMVLALVIAARDFKFLRYLMEEAWSAPHLLVGRAQGISPTRLLAAHVLPNIALRLRALATLSLVTALGALLPVEVIFNVPGVGQLAWSAVMNRDLPVLAAVSVLMAGAVAAAEWMALQPEIKAAIQPAIAEAR